MASGRGRHAAKVGPGAVRKARPTSYGSRPGAHSSAPAGHHSRRFSPSASSPAPAPSSDLEDRTTLWIRVVLVLMLVVGVGLLLYPTVADLWNSHVQSRVVVSYAETVEQMPAERKEFLLNRARRYNTELVEESNRWQPSEADLAEYEDELDVTGDGVMAYVEIPKIDVNLPIYHGTSEAVLTVGIGHIEGSSLPVGGPGTHTVISGHRGLPSARLFTDIDQLSEGDRFYLHALDQTLAYEVDQILTVEPGDFSALEIDEGSDLCTLVTCTPYGINTHRLLVRGHRVELEEGEAAGAEPAADNRILWLAGAMVVLAGVAVGAAAITRRRGAGGRGGTRHGRY